MRITGKTRFNTFIVTIVLLLLLFIPGCKQPISNTDDYTSDRVAVTAQVIIDELGTNLESSGLSSQQVGLVTDGASAGVIGGGADLSSTDIYNVMPFITSGAVGGLSGTSFYNDDFRIMVLEYILESLSGSLDGREVQSPTFSRLVDPNADVMRAILAGITSAAIKSLDTIGVTDDNLPDAAGIVIGTLVNNMDNAGVTSTYVGDAAGDLVNAAVAGLSDIIGSETALQDAVGIIAGTAVETLAEVDIEGFDTEDIPDAVGSIASGVISAIDSPTLISSATSGIAQAAAGITDDSVVYASIVEATVSGATEGLAENTNADMSDMVTVFGTITSEASEQFASATVDSATLNEDDVISSVITGASEGAANADDAALNDAAEIKSAIVLSDSDGEDIDLSTVTGIDDNIDDGIAQSDNEAPVISPVSGKTIEGGVSLTITADASDADGDTLTYAWFISSQPDTGDGVFDGSSILSHVTFTAERIGEYKLRLEVNDGKETVFTFISVEVTAPVNTDAQGRISAGIDLITGVLERDYEGAIAQFAQVTSADGALLYAEALYRQGICYNDLEDMDNAKLKYQAAIDTAKAVGTAESFVWEAHATNKLAWCIAQTDTDSAIALITPIINLAGTDADHPDGEWIAESFHYRGACYLRAGEFDDAQSDVDASFLCSDSTPLIILWNNFDVAHINWRRGNLADATTGFLALARDPDLIARTGQYEGLDIFDKYDGIRWAYACAGWSANDNDTVSASTITSFYDEAIALAGAPDWWPSLFFEEKGWRYRQKADNGTDSDFNGNYTSAEQAFKDSFAGNSYSNENGFAEHARLALGWLYENWGNTDSSKEDLILPAYLNAYYNASIPKNKIRAGVQVGEYYMWHADDNDAAIAQFNTVLSLDTSECPLQEARAILRLGHAWMRKGWDADNSVGTDYISYFTKALTYLEQISLSAYPVLNPRDMWIYFEALSDRAEALQQLGRGDEALSMLQDLIADPDISAENKAHFQYSIGQIYFDEGRDYRDDGEYTSALSSFDDAIAAFSLVASVEDGRWKAEAVLESGEVENHKGWIYDDDRWTTRPASWETDMNTAFTNAIDYFRQVTTAAYPDLVGHDDWLFFEAKRREAEALSSRNNAGDTDAALLILENIDTVPGYREEEALYILNEIAGIYRRVIDCDWGTYDNTIKTDFENAVDASQAVIDESVSQGYPDDGLIAADAYENMGWIYSQQLECIWSSITDGDIPALFPGIEADYNEAFNNAESILKAGIIFKPSGFYPDGGKVAAICQLRLAQLNNNSSWRVRDRTPDFDNVPDAVTEYYDYLEYARTAYELLLANIDNDVYSADDWTFSEALEQLPSVLMDLMHISNVIGGPSDKITLDLLQTYMNRVYSLMAQAAASPGMQRDRLAYMYSRTGENLTHAAERVHEYDLLMDIISGTVTIQDADWQTHSQIAEVYLEQVIENFTDVNGGEVSANAYFYRGQLYRQWADFLTEDNEIDLARTYYNAALDDFEMTKSGGSKSSLVDGWVQSYSNDCITDINGILAADPFI